MDYRKVKAGRTYYFYKARRMFEWLLKVKCVEEWPREKFEILQNASYRTWAYPVGATVKLSFSYLYTHLETVVKKILKSGWQQDVIVSAFKKRP